MLRSFASHDVSPGNNHVGLAAHFLMGGQDKLDGQNRGRGVNVNVKL